jgi:hypothetical protein
MPKTIYITGLLSLMDAAVKELEAMGFKRESNSTPNSDSWYEGTPLSDLTWDVGAPSLAILPKSATIRFEYSGSNPSTYLKLPADWDLMMKAAQEIMVQFKAAQSMGQEWVGKLIKYDRIGGGYPYYSTMFTKMGFANKVENSRVKPGDLCRIFAVDRHETNGDLLAGCRTIDGREVLCTLPKPGDAAPYLIDMTGKEDAEDVMEFLRIERKEFRTGEFVTCLSGYNNSRQYDKTTYGGAGYIQGMTFEVKDNFGGNVLWPVRSTALPKEYNCNGIYNFAVRLATEGEIKEYKRKVVEKVRIQVNENIVEVFPGKSITAVGVGEITFTSLAKMYQDLVKSSSEMNGFAVRVSNVDIGCWKGVPVEKIQEILNAYNRR